MISSKDTIIYVCCTPNQLFLTLLRVLLFKEKSAILLLADHLKLIPWDWEGKYFDKIILYPNNQVLESWREYKKNNKHTVFSWAKALMKVVEENVNVAQFEGYLKEAQIHIYVDMEPFVSYLLLRAEQSDFVLIEDGEIIYTRPKKDLFYWVKRLTSYPLTFGQDRRVVQIQVTTPSRLSKKQREKSIEVNHGTMLKELGDIEKNILLDFYKLDNLESLTSKKKTLLLLTQPLSEDKLISEDYKQNLYDKVLEPYKKEYKLYIKPHPREKSTYNEFNDIEVINNDFPAELLSLIGVQFDIAISLFSTAVRDFPAKEKVFLGLEYDSKVEKAWLNSIGAKKKH